MALHAISLLTHRRLIDDIERHRSDPQLIVLSRPSAQHHADRFDRAGKWIGRALEDAREFLDSGGEHRDPIDLRIDDQATESDVRRGSASSLTRQ